MILIGNDIVKVKRIQSLIKNYKSRFLDKIFTDHEKQYCNSRINSEIHYSGRFAAKEAVKKILLQENPNSIVLLRNIEVYRLDDKPPKIRLKGEPEKKIQLSISHTNEYATAIVLMESK